MVTTVISATFLGSRAAEMGKKTLCGFPATLPRISHTQHWRPLMSVLAIIIRENMMWRRVWIMEAWLSIPPIALVFSAIQSLQFNTSHSNVSLRVFLSWNIPNSHCRKCLLKAFASLKTLPQSWQVVLVPPAVFIVLQSALH